MPTMRSQGGAQANAVSGGGVQGKTATAYGPFASEGMPMQGEAGQQDNGLQIYGPFNSLVGGRPVAGEPAPGQGLKEKTFVKATAGQTAAGPIGGAMTAIGKALGAGQLIPGGAGKALTNFAYDPKAAQAGVLSAGNALRSVAQAAPKVALGAAGQAAQKVSGWLRSLFGK
jgi:hypothetical protein